MRCKERLAQYLTENGVPFKAMSHPTAYTAQEVAAAQGVSGKQLAKVVIVKADDKPVMLVLQASAMVDLRKAAQMLGAKALTLAREGDFAELFPDCEVGSMPPFGNLYNVPVYVDEGLAAQDEIVFAVGTHTDTFKMKYADFARLASPVVRAFAK
ncbi:MAG: YbaK/EbsC family protein [Anaerolineae bacterium]|nr:YbaK/EbsC family protein [Anaerolineae bacterium]